MDSATLIFVALITLVGGLVAGAFVGERAAHRADAAQAPPVALAPVSALPPAEPGPRREPNAHIHTWRHRSSEDVAGEHVEIYCCLDCAAVERRIVEAHRKGGTHV